MNKSYWIYYDGDYDIYHVNSANTRREHRGMDIACFWKIQMPYASIRFVKEIDIPSPSSLKAYINGFGCVEIDGKEFPVNTEVAIPAGKHYIQVNVTNPGGLPCAYVESDVCPSDKSWRANCFAGPWVGVGCNEYYNSKDKCPTSLPYEYIRVDVCRSIEAEGGMLYDFGKEIFGYLYIENANANLTYDIYYGESDKEALDTAYTYITDSVSGKESYKLRQRAFRYIYVKGEAQGLKLYADLEVLPLKQRGYFECDNELFNKIYDVSAYTFLLNCREGFFDGLKRDRWIWGGDAYQSARINSYLFFDKEIEQRTARGLIGKLPVDSHINTIMDYSLLWIIGIYEHHMNYGDLEYLKNIYPMIIEMIKFCETRLNEDGFIQGLGPDWTFIDWSDIDKTGAVCAEQMLLVRAYDCISYLASEVEQDKDSDIYYSKASELMELVNKYYWSDELGAFIDSYSSGKNNVTRHANIFALMYGLAQDWQKEAILKNVLKNDAITKITTPYFKGYELDVLAKLGEYELIEESLTSYYGSMVNLGATTIWEEYDPTMSGDEHYAMYGGRYDKSLCHAWGASPIYIFGKYYLGVSPLEYGYEEFIVEPKLGGLGYIKGCVPINGGEVYVELDKHTLKVKATACGGELRFNGKRYTLKANEEITITY